MKKILFVIALLMLQGFSVQADEEPAAEQMKVMVLFNYTGTEAQVMDLIDRLSKESDGTIFTQVETNGEKWIIGCRSSQDCVAYKAEIKIETIEE